GEDIVSDGPGCPMPPPLPGEWLQPATATNTNARARLWVIVHLTSMDPDILLALPGERVGYFR
ncbi:MAG: hypothetical protein ACXVDD_14595, partial [Polyangia bacterium]